MIFIETPVFSKAVQRLMSDEQYRRLQSAMAVRPGLGDVIPGSGGLRKLRWSVPGHGKRGGARVIYYWAVSLNEIYMLLAYTKAEQEDLTPKQIKLLRQIVETWNDG
jgi:hypothetical protein